MVMTAPIKRETPVVRGNMVTRISQRRSFGAGRQASDVENDTTPN